MNKFRKDLSIGKTSHVPGKFNLLQGYLINTLINTKLMQLQ